MALSTIITTRVCVEQDGTIAVNRVKTFTDDTDGTTGSNTLNVAYTPNTDPATLPAGRIRQIANLVWTPAVVAAWIAANPVTP